MASFSEVRKFKCQDWDCQDPKCCAAGYKFIWPELIGMDGHKAKRIIEREHPHVYVKVVPKDDYTTKVSCCNRVWVFVDNNGKVFAAPQIG